MKNNNNSKKVRSLLVRGGEALAITSVLLAIVGCSPNKTDTDNSSSGMEMVTECTVSTTTSTPVTSTTTQSTTTNTITTVVTTESTMMNTQITTTVQENIVQTEPIEYEYEYEYESDNIIIEETESSPTESSPVVESYLPITEYERILLCNIVANEAGSDWISIYDKASVVACVMNRVNSASFPNSIEGVLTQSYQFSGYYASSYYYSTVTDACIEAVDYYFNNPNEFGSWLYFEGNGTNNYFH